MKNSMGKKSNVSSRQKTQQSKKRIKLYWKKGERAVSSDTVFISTKSILFIALSIISGFINLVCISNLTKSPYIIGWLESKNAGWIVVPGAVVLGLISIGLDGLKCIHAIQINTLAELVRKTDDETAATQKTVKRLKSVRVKWICSYVLYIALSVLTSMSLALTSVGSAIRENETIITSITDDYSELALLDSNQKSDKNDRRDLTRENIEGNKKAREAAEKDVLTGWGYIEDYRDARDKIRNDPNLEESEKDEKIKELIKKVTNLVPIINGKQADYISQTELKQKLLQISTSNEVDNTNAEIIKDLIAENTEEINAVILGLEGRYHHTDKTPVSFLDEEGNPVTAMTALQTLKTLKNEYQIGGNSDIGSSAKMFSIFADVINTRKDKNTSGFGTTETLIMLFLLFLSLLVEIGINQVSTKSKISRKLWGQFSQYYPKNFDVDHFMIGVYIDQVRAGVMNIDQCEESCREAVEMMKYTPEYFIRKYGDSVLKEKYGIADNVNLDELTEKQKQELAKVQSELNKLREENEALKNREPEIKEVIKEVPVEKIVEKEIVKEVPVVVEKEKPVEIIKEKPVRKIIEKGLSSKVDEKAAELDDLIKDI